jgi:3-oxoadipate enol-lactonase
MAGHFIDTGRARLWVETTGSGPETIVFAHSLFFDRREFEHQVAAFGADYTVVTYDQRGHGQTGLSADGRYDQEALAEDAIALIEQLGAAVHFVGQSMGGFVGLRIAARRPDLLHTLVVCGSSADAESDPAKFEPLVSHLLANGTHGVEDTLMEVMFGKTSLADPALAAGLAEWRNRFTGLPREAIGLAAAGVVERGAILPALHRTPVPVLAISGDEDWVYPADHAERIAARVPTGRAAAIAAAGHSGIWERPEATNALIHDWLDTHAHKQPQASVA